MSVAAASVHRVVFHADDFGMNEDVNAGILDSFRRGILTSTSLLANAPAALHACKMWGPLLRDISDGKIESSQARSELGDPALPFDLGVHLNLTQGFPLTGDRYPAELLNERGEFPGIGMLFSRIHWLSSVKLARVADELQAQIQWMCDHDLTPSHLNGHQYVELLPPVTRMLPELLRLYQIPVCRVARESGLMGTVLSQGRLLDWCVGRVKRQYANRFLRVMRRTSVRFPDLFFGTAHAGKIDLRTMSSFLRRARAVTATEIGIHPGMAPTTGGLPVNNPWFDPLQDWRAAERDLLCSPDLRELMINQGVKLGRLRLLTARSQ